MPERPIPVGAGSKMWGCGCSLAEIAGSNTGRCVGVCLFWVLCVVRKRGLCDEPITHPESHRGWYSL